MRVDLYVLQLGFQPADLVDVPQLESVRYKVWYVSKRVSSVTLITSGVFFIYAGVTGVALVFFFFFVPETKGASLDEVEMLFMTREERRRKQENLNHRQISPADIEPAKEKL